MTLLKLNGGEAAGPTPIMVKPTNTRGTVLAAWFEELNQCYKDMARFGSMEPDIIFRSLSSWTARASHMRAQINRSDSKTDQNFRIKQIDPFISECDRQFKIWSRVFSVMQMDYDMAGGQM